MAALRSKLTGNATVSIELRRDDGVNKAIVPGESHSMIRFLILASLLASPAFADNPIVVKSSTAQTAVVELYTSEGCSSCPPADRWLSSLVTAPRQELDLLALSFHVDYWDYLGWKDRFSDADYTRRQRVLGANNQQRTIYTPEFFVNGKETRGAANILDAIQQSNASNAELELQLTVSRDESALLLVLESPSRQESMEQLHHRYIVYENNLSTEVQRGENSGKLLKHQQVVRYMSPAGNLRQQNQHRIEIGPDWQAENLGVAVLVTSPGNRDYLQAIHTPVSSLLASR